MKKQIKQTIGVFLLSLLSSVLALQAQYNVDSIKWGIQQEYFKKGFVVDMKIIKSDNKSVYYYCNTNMDGVFCDYDPSIIDLSNHYIVKHDISSGANRIYEIKQDVKEYKLNFMKHLYINGSVQVIFSYFNKRDGIYYLFKESIDIDKMESNNDIKKVAEINLINQKNTVLESSFLDYQNNKFIFRYKLLTKNKIQTFGLEVFDKEFNKEWSASDIAITATGVNYESNYRIDNEGNVYAIQRNFEKEEDYMKNYSKSKVWAVCYSKDSKPNVIPLMLENNNFITSQELNINKNGDVICAGLYANLGNTSAIGAYSIILEPKLTKIKSINSKAFSNEILLKGVDEKIKNDELKKIISNKDFEKDFGYKMNEIYLRNDGGFDVVAEKVKTEYVKFNNEVTGYFYYDDLLVLVYNADGSINWIQKIPKYEYFENNSRLAASYFMKHDKNDNMHFIFNLGNNFNLKPKSKTVTISLDKQGNEKFKELESKYEISAITCPKFFDITEDGTVITVMYNYRTTISRLLTKKNCLTFGSYTF